MTDFVKGMLLLATNELTVAQTLEGDAQVSCLVRARQYLREVLIVAGKCKRKVVVRKAKKGKKAT